MRWRAPLVLGVAVAIAGAPAAVADPFGYSTPAGCPDREAFAALLAQQGVDAVMLDGVAVAIERDGDGFRAVIEAGGGARSVAAPSCDEVAEASALIVAFLVTRAAADAAEDRPATRPDVATATGDRAGPAPRATSTPVFTPMGIAAAAVRPPRRPPRVIVSVAAGVATDLGALPRAAPGGRVFVAIARGAFTAELGGSLWQSEEVAGDDGAVAARIELWDVSAAACGGLDWWRGCGGLEIGRITGRGLDVEGARTDSSAWVAAFAEVAAQWRFVGPVAVEARVGVRAPIAAPRFVLAGGEVLHDPAPVAARLGLGLRIEIR